MKVIQAGGEIIDLGVTEATPTVGIVDYSRRETDDYGVTTVVERGFARRMSVRLIAPFAGVDALQRNLANLRAKSARWVADERYDWLNFRGFYKDFEIDLALPPVSYCTLSIEGLTASEPFVDPGGDPAPGGAASSLQLLQPVPVVGAALVASSVAEADYSEWSAEITYPLGARVIKAATHRIYESAALANLGDDPEAASGKWADIGPTNRWAMFDQALGSITSAEGQVSVTIAAGMIDAVALLDVRGATVRVQAGVYDRTASPNESGTATFLDLPLAAGQVAVTITGPGTVEVGTLLVGNLVALGLTTDSPKAAIDDYSRKEADEFGDVIVVERAWAKRMTARAMIRTDALDVVAGRIAAVRARPALWIGKDGLESLTIYGFFKEFSIEVDSTVSRLNLSVEGLSTAGKVEPLGASIDWPDIADPVGTKPEDNATVGAPPGTPVADGTAQDVMAALKALASTTTAADIVAGAQSLIAQHRNNLLAVYSAQLLGEERKARWERLTHFDGIEIATRVRQEITERIEQGEAFVQLVTEIEATATDGINAAMAAIETEQTVRASADAAETTARELALSLFRSDVDGHVADLQAAISSEATTRAAVDGAETAERTLAISTLQGAVNGQVADLQAAITSEATTRANADGAETAERTLAISTLQGVLDGHVANLSAAIASEATTRADADGAEAQARQALSAALDGAVSDLNAAIVIEQGARVTADQAEATARAALAATLGGDIATVSALVLAEETARVSEDAALASSVSTVSAGLDGANASIQTIAAAQVTGDQALALLSTTVEARTASRIELVAIGGDNRAELRLFADANGGAGVRLVGDLEVDGNVLVAGSISTGKVAPGSMTGSAAVRSDGSFETAWVTVAEIYYDVRAGESGVEVTASCLIDLAPAPTVNRGYVRLLRDNTYLDIPELEVARTGSPTPFSFPALLSGLAGVCNWKLQARALHPPADGVENHGAILTQISVKEFKK
jgi:hypothetical protein